ncbi:unnamed protein product [Peniophora sp. CBMAI 1063]|nr:unnamed protein product [Peniophora sp. CBMAI 1063]
MAITNIASGETYLIVNSLNYKAVDLPEDQEPSADHEAVVGYTAHGDRTQKWVFEGDAKKGYSIKHAGDGKALVIAGHAEPGAELTTSDDTSARIPWIVNHVKDDLFELQWPAEESLVVELQDDGQFSPGNNLTLANRSEDEKSEERKRQLWVFEENSTGPSLVSIP